MSVYIKTNDGWARNYQVGKGDWKVSTVPDMAQAVRFSSREYAQNIIDHLPAKMQAHIVPALKLFLISQTAVSGYDTYDSAVVAAESEEAAANMHPSNGEPIDSSSIDCRWTTTPSDVEVTYLGEAIDIIKPQVICASFNAG